jgi:hypothetical protein
MSTANSQNYFIPTDTLVQSNYSNWLSGYRVNDNMVNKELTFVITGNANSSKMLQINGVRCRENLAPWCNPAPVTSSCPTAFKLWSSPSTWSSGKVPAAGEDVEIPVNQTIVFDLAESPIYNLITVNGCLKFLNSTIDQHLQAYLINVFAGSFYIGSSTQYFNKKATITLYGQYDSPTVTFGNLAEGGNKGIFNTGNIGFFGKPRTAGSYLSRLTAVA